MISTLYLILFSLIGTQNQEYCKLQGAVYIEESAKFANYIVYEEDSEAFADMLIYEEINKLFADKPGKWHFVESKGLAEFTVYFTEDRGKAHFTVYFTESENFAGCQ